MYGNVDRCNASYTNCSRTTFMHEFTDIVNTMNSHENQLHRPLLQFMECPHTNLILVQLTLDCICRTWSQISNLCCYCWRRYRSSSRSTAAHAFFHVERCENGCFSGGVAKNTRCRYCDPYHKIHRFSMLSGLSHGPPR